MRSREYIDVCKCASFAPHTPSAWRSLEIEGHHAPALFGAIKSIDLNANYYYSAYGITVMDFESSLNAILFLPLTRTPHRSFQLDGRMAHCVLTANAFMRRSGKISGVERHRWLDRLLCAGVRTEGDLRLWMREFFPARGARLWETCRRQADRFLEIGVKVFGWSAPKSFPSLEKGESGNLFAGPLNGQVLSQSIGLPCPAVLFGKGPLNFDLPLFAVFNSRKPRLISPDSDWLQALRFFFRSLDFRKITLAASAGTLTHDLVGAHASRSGFAQFLVLPFPLMHADRELFETYGKMANGMPVLSCMLGSISCSKSQAQVCRDRILGVVANLHLVLEIRSRGNLSAALEEIQAKSPRPQLIYEQGEINLSNAGNYSLLKKFPEYARGFKFHRSLGPPVAPPVKARSAAEKIHYSQRGDIAWDDYLFHYTRGCAGPWPGETYRQYLLDLFDGRPLSGHSALETLIRILQEGLIRAGSRMIRGGTAVISWSSHAPQELFVMRKWNRALLRWMVEPYGIAVRRDILRSFGAKPAVYGSERSIQARRTRKVPFPVEPRLHVRVLEA